MDTNRIRRVMWAVVYFVLIGMLMCVMDARGEEVNIEAVIQIESGGNPNAYNEKSGARGLCQITEIVLMDCVQQTNGRIKYKNLNIDIFKGGVTVFCLYEPDTNVALGAWYLNTRIPQMLRAYKIPDTIENRLISYNAGIKVCKDYHEGKIKRLPKETRQYLEKYHKLTEGK